MQALLPVVTRSCQKINTTASWRENGLWISTQRETRQRGGGRREQGGTHSARKASHHPQRGSYRAGGVAAKPGPVPSEQLPLGSGAVPRVPSVTALSTSARSRRRCKVLWGPGQGPKCRPRTPIDPGWRGAHLPNKETKAFVGPGLRCDHLAPSARLGQLPCSCMQGTVLSAGHG